MTKDIARVSLIELLTKGHAHMSLLDAVKDFPLELINKRPSHVPYTFWHLIEHIRISQNDIVDFSQNPKYLSKEWPEDYWPEKDAKADEKMWKQTISDFIHDQKEFIALLEDPKNDLFEPFSWGEGQSLFREAILIADHNSYHIGEFAILRQVEDAWPKAAK